MTVLKKNRYHIVNCSSFAQNEDIFTQVA